jgi:hypothetical protein
MKTFPRMVAPLLLATASLVASGSTAWAQCAKRVVIYLDVSGSMDPAGRHGDKSPFRQSLRAVATLLADRGFIEAQDVVELVPFGETVEARPPATGPVEISKAIESLRTIATVEDTNLAKVLEDFAKRLGSGSSFTRQVFIIASDFAHEPRAVRRNMAGDWAAGLQKVVPDLNQAFTANPRVAVLLFRAPASGTTRSGETRQDLQRRVVGDLLQVFAPRVEVLPVGIGGLNDEDLGNQVRRQLLNPPEIKAHLDARDSSRIQVDVTNTNCVPVTVSAVSVRCAEAAGGAPPQPVSLAIDPAGKTLAPAGTPEATLSLQEKRPVGGCWDTSQTFMAEATAAGGLQASSRGTTATTLTFKPTAAYREDSLWSSILRLDLTMRGQYSTPKTYDVQIKDASGVYRVAGCRIAAPDDLSPDADKPYRIYLALHSEVMPRVEHGAPVQVVFRGDDTQQENVTVQADDARSNAGKVNNIVTFFILVAGAALYFFNRRDASLGVFRFGSLVPIMTSCLLPLVYTLLRRDLLERWSLNGVDVVGYLVTAGAAGAMAFFCIRTMHFRKQARLVYSDGDFAMEPYVNSINRGWSALGAAIAAAILVVAMFWLARFIHPLLASGSPTVIQTMKEGG